MRLYITNLSLWVLILFYAPVVLWLMLRIWRMPQLQGVKKTLALISAALLAYAIPLGDVTVNSIAMQRVCPSAGLRVYKTVKVEGYVTTIGDGRTLKTHRYEFIETPQLKTDGSYHWKHYEKDQDGGIREKILDEPMADYEVIGGQWHVDRTRGVEVTTDVIRSRRSGEVLAELNLFNPLPGWLDKILVIRWFGTGGRRGCWGEPASMVDVSDILIPKHSN